jgi:hypothetical protein
MIIDYCKLAWDNGISDTKFKWRLNKMPAPKRSPIARASIKRIGHLGRKNQLSPKAQREMHERISRRARELK